MSARARWIDAALVLLALGGAVHLLTTSGEPTSADLLARRDNVFPFFPSDQLRSLELTQSAPGRSFILRRNDDSDEPRSFLFGATGEKKADSALTSELLSALEFATWSHRPSGEPSEAAGEAAAGFSSPTLELTLTFETARARLLVGEKLPGSPERYRARMEMGSTTTTGLIPAELVERLLEDERSFQGRLLLPYAKSELRALTLERPDARLTLTADEAGFRLSAPSSSGPGISGVRADRDAVDQLLFQLARVSVERFLELPEARAELAKEPRPVTVEQTAEDGGRARVTLGGVCPGAPNSIVALRTAPDEVAGCVPAGVLPVLRTTAEPLVSRTLVSLSADAIDHALVSGPRGEVDVMRQGAAFELREATGGDAKPRPVSLALGNEFLEKLTRARGELRPGPAPSREPTGRVVLVGHGVAVSGLSSRGDEPGAPSPSAPPGDPTLRGELRLWHTGDEILVERKDDGALLAFPRKSAWFLEGSKLWSLERELTAIDEDAVRGLRLEGAGLDVTLERRDGALVLTRPSGVRVDARLLGNLTDALEHLEVKRWLDEAVSIERPRLSLRVDWEKAGRPERFELQVGPRVGGGFVGVSPNAPAPFVLSPALVRLLETSLVDRSPLVLDPGAYEALHLVTERGATRFERRGDVLVPTSGEDEELGAWVEEQLKQLQPLALAHLGAPRAEEGFTRPTLRLEAKLTSREGRAETISVTIGALTSFQDTPAYFARVASVDGTYYVDALALRALLDSL